MKKILFLLLMTVYGYGQSLPSPSYNNTTTNTLKIKTPATVTSVNFLSTVELDGSVAKIAPGNLGFLKTVDLNLTNTLTGGNTTSLTAKFQADASNYTQINYEGIIGQYRGTSFYYNNNGFSIPSGSGTYLIGNAFGESVEVTNTVDKRNRLYFSKSTTGLANWRFTEKSTGDYIIPSAADVLNKSSQTNIVYGTDGLGNQINYTSDYLENKQSLRDFYNSLYNYSLAPTSSFIGIACWGDSVSPETWAPFTLALRSRYQIGCITYEGAGLGLGGAPFVSSSGTIFDSLTATVDQSVYDGSGGFADFTYLPSANHKVLSSGATLTFGTGQSTAFVDARAYFATGPGMGSVLVELLNEAGSTVLNSTTINLSGASLNATKAQFSVAKNQKYQMRITATGKVVFLLGGFFRDNGILPIQLGRGGSTLLQNNYCDKTILNYIMSEFKISLMFLQCKEEGLPGSIAPTMSTLNTFTTVSKIIVGSAPDSSTASTQIANNLLFREAALANDMCYYDGYKVMKNWAEVVRLGWNRDATHIDVDGTQYLGLMLQQSLNYFDQINAVEKKDINNIAIGGNVATNSLKISQGDGTRDTIDVIVNGGGGVPTEVLGRNFRSIAFGIFSTEQPIISAYSSTTIGVFNRAGNSLRNFRISNLQSESITLLNSPSTSTTTYDLLVRNSANGNVEKIIGAKTYNALITQSSTSAPTVTVLGTNIIGTIVWTRTGVGTYVGTLTGAFTANKTLCFVNNTVNGFVTFQQTTANTVTLTTSDITGTLTDGLLTNNSIKIEVNP